MTAIELEKQKQFSELNGSPSFGAEQTPRKITTRRGRHRSGKSVGYAKMHRNDTNISSTTNTDHGESLLNDDHHESAVNYPSDIESRSAHLLPIASEMQYTPARGKPGERVEPYSEDEEDEYEEMEQCQEDVEEEADNESETETEESVEEDEEECEEVVKVSSK